MKPPGQLRISAMTLDCADPTQLAEFYRQATGLALDERSTEEFAGLRSSDGFFFGFQRIPDYRPPSWPEPDVAQQAHLDFDVPGLDQAQALLVELGARLPHFQPGGERWRVLLDPAGHPFCISEVRDRTPPDDDDD